MSMLWAEMWLQGGPKIHFPRHDFVLKTLGRNEKRPCRKGPSPKPSIPPAQGPPVRVLVYLSSPWVRAFTGNATSLGETWYDFNQLGATVGVIFCALRRNVLGYLTGAGAGLVL